MLRATTFSVFFIAASAVFAGCSDQGEGERCDRGNGDSDCQGGLVCTAASSLAKGSKTNQDWALCCPPSGIPATVEACNPVAPGTGAGGSPSTGGADSGTADAAHEAGTGGASHADASTGGRATGGASQSGGATGSGGRSSGGASSTGGAPHDASTDGRG